MTDEELAKGLGSHDDPRWPQAIAKLEPQKRATYERLLGFADEWNLYAAGFGPKPQGALVDTERSTSRRRAWR